MLFGKTSAVKYSTDTTINYEKNRKPKNFEYLGITLYEDLFEHHKTSLEKIKQASHVGFFTDWESF